jgi:hypothetical protein
MVHRVVEDHRTLHSSGGHSTLDGRRSCPYRHCSFPCHRHRSRFEVDQSFVVQSLVAVAVEEEACSKSMDMNESLEKIESCIHILLLLCMLLIPVVEHLFLDLVNETHFLLMYILLIDVL